MGELTLEQRRALALAAARKRAAEAGATIGPRTNAVEQAGSGVNEGIANMAGLPVDAMTGALNMGLRAVGRDPIEAPFGGSDSIRRWLDPFISDVDPQSAVQRIARRAGQDVGAGAVAAPLAGIASAGGMAASTAVDAASGLGSGAAAEYTDNPVVQMIAGLLAGGGAIGAGYAARPAADVPSNDMLRARAGALYDRVEESGVALDPRQAQELQARVSSGVWETMDPPSQPRAVSAVNRVYDANAFTPDGTAPLMDVEKARRFAGRNVLASNTADDAEKEVGVTIRREIDRYLDEIAAQPGAEGAVRDLQAARETSRRYLASEAVDAADDKAMRRAAATGTGGNTMNTPRQVINSILNSKAQSASFKPNEIDAMRGIVEGTPLINGLRRVGAFSPDRGGLPAMFNMLAVGGAATTGSAATTAMVATPGVVGFIARQLGESLTNKQVENLSRMIRYGGELPAKSLSEAERRVAAAMLSAQAANAEQ